MDEEQRSLLIRSFSHYSSSPGLELRYGARGFVGDESVLKSAAYRIGILAALRSMKSKSVAGVMITACGRSGEKNEVRIIDPDDGALIAEWEPLADSVANAVDPDEFVTLIEESVNKENISFDGGQPAEVLLARDTGPSGEALLEAAKQGISSVAGTIFHDMGILTTPQLHWLVHARNKGMKASEHDYFQNLSCSYRCLVDKIPEGSAADKIGESLVVDGANSVGGDKIEVLKDLCDGLVIEIRNTSKSGAIGVGVDFILEQKILPSGFGSSDIDFRCASLDGDADRLLYFSVLPSQEIEIVDGNKILFLFTLFINEQLTVLREVENETEEGHYHARLGILQSAYKIGTSTNYLKSLGLDVVSFPPGTRSLQTVASKYDVGIYFEADGHGGILFSENYVSWLEAKNNELLSSSEGSRKQLTVSRLLAVSRMMNTTVSDALASLLLTEAILQNNGWSLQKWNEIYCDLANRQLNEVELADTTAFATENPKTVEISHSGTKEVADTFTAEANIEVVEAFDETNTQQYVADNQSHKAEDTLLRGSSDFPHDDSAMSAVANSEGDINEGIAMNGIVHMVRTDVDEESTSSLEGSATAVADGENVVDEIVRKPFYYLIRIPNYDDEKLTEQIRSAEMLLEERTRNRDAVLTEYWQHKESCQKLRANLQAAILEKRAARDLFRAKRKEIDSAQSLVNIAKDAMTIEDLDNKVANMEHTIQHETMSLNEEKKLIREIKQSKQLREQLLATSKKKGVQEALDHKDENEDRVKVLRKEMDALKHKLSEAELVVKTATRTLDSEHAILNELRRKLTLSHDVRQEAYSNLQNLRSQWSRRFVAYNFFKYKKSVSPVSFSSMLY